MNVFVDSEFSGLGSDPRLLSIALVAEGDGELYIELSSGWKVEQCSRWVVEHVLPLLGKGEQLSRTEAAKRIDAWLDGLASPPSLIVDSDWDAELILALFKESGIPDGKRRMHVLRFASKAKSEEFERAKQRYFAEHGSQHHALSDANALRFAFDEVPLR